MKTLCLKSLFILGFGGVSHASVNLSFDFGYILAANGTAITVGSKVLIVADTIGNGFVGSEVGAFGGSYFNTSLPFGASFNDGSTWGADDLVLGQLTIYDPGLGSGQLTKLASNSLIINYVGNLGVGDRLGLYFFPGTTSATIPFGAQYGFYSQPNGFDTESGGDHPMALPPDGFVNSISYYSPQLFSDFGADASGTLFQPPADFRASVFVPEPSTFAGLIGAVAFCFSFLKRRFR